MDFGDKPIPALFDAMAAAERIQDDQLAIPRRFATTMREIWALQPRFDNRDGSRPIACWSSRAFAPATTSWRYARRWAVPAGAGGLVDGISGGRRSPAPGADCRRPPQRRGAHRRQKTAAARKPNGQGQPMDDGE